MSDPLFTVQAMTTLSDRDRAILDLERQFFAQPGSKERAMMERLGLDRTSYYSRLSQIIRNPDALAHDPVTVNRLSRLRNTRSRARAIRRIG